MSKEIVTAETNLGKKTRKPRETKLPSVDEVVEMTKRIHLTSLHELSKKINSELDRRVKEIKELLNTVEA